MKFLIYFTVIFLLSPFVASAQQLTFSKVWSNYPLRGENGLNILEFEGGYLLVTANDCTDSGGNYCVTLVKLSLNGEIEWTKEFGYSGTLYKQIVVHNNKIYLVGTIQVPEFQFTLLCLDSNANMLWQREFGEKLKREIAVDLTLTHDQFLLVSGGRDRNITHQLEWLPVVTKVNLQGDSITQFNFNEQYDASILKKTIETIQHDYIISYTYCPDGCFVEQHAGMICFDSIGNKKWELDLPQSDLSYGCFVSQMDSNTLAVKWHIDFNWPAHDPTPPAIFFTDMLGNIQDTFAFHSRTRKEVHYIEAVWEKGLVGSGSNFTDTLVNTQGGWAFRMNESREILWDRTYLDTLNKGESFGLNQIIPTSDGGYIAIGTISNFTTGVFESHIWVLKLDSIGCLNPNCPPMNTTKAEEPEFLKGRDIKIYPNPASDYVYIDFPEEFTDEFTLGEVSISLIAANGAILSTEQVSNRLHEMRFTVPASGVYFIQIRSGNELLTSKRIVIQP